MESNTTNDMSGIDVSPFQGFRFLSSAFTQGVALGCHISAHSSLQRTVFRRVIVERISNGWKMAARQLPIFGNTIPVRHHPLTITHSPCLPF
jgi:hypothetical protein